ncbi:MAG: glycosyltransferase, partial [Gemmatimonadota bacterium]|nr:glycosyltransferase [Gemmatimonadota bacterium]
VDPPDPLDPGPALRRWITATLRFPDGQLGFLPPAVGAALDPAHPPPDIVYTTGPPVTAHLTGLTLHALSGRPWIAEYRDPWLVDGAPCRPPALRCAWTDRCERWLEGRCLAAAAEVIAVSKGIAAEVAPRRAELGRPPPKVVLNGIPDLAPLGEPRRSGPRRILHLGNLYAFRDPRPFLEGLAALLAERSWGPTDIEVEMLGEPPAAPFRRFASSLGLDEVVRFTGWVDHETGQDRLRRADVLLLLAQGQPLQIPNKLYEYLGSRRPILAFADPEGETARMLRRAGGGVILTGAEVPARIAAELSGLLDHGRDVAAGADLDVLEEWKTERQMRRLVGIVRGVPTRASNERT